MLGKYTVHPQNVQLLNVQLQNVQLQDVQLQDVQLQDVQLQDVQLQDLQLQDVQLQNVQLQNVQLQDVQITRRPDYKTSSYHVYQPDLIRLYLLSLYCTICTVKKGYGFSRPQPGCHLPNSPWPGIIILLPAW
jgi:Rieske Fe-S protein